MQTEEMLMKLGLASETLQRLAENYEDSTGACPGSWAITGAVNNIVEVMRSLESSLAAGDGGKKNEIQ